MGTRNNPSPGGLRQGLEATTRRTRTRKQPVRVSKMANVSNTSESDGEVANTTAPQTQNPQQPSSALQPSTSSSRAQVEQVLDSVEAAEPRAIAPIPQRRHNTRSSRSVSPSLALSLDNIDRSQNPNSKGKGRARSSSASSTHQGVEAASARGGKRKLSSDDDVDELERAPTKRTKSVHRNPSTSKRTARGRGKPLASPIAEEDEVDEYAFRSNKRKVRGKLPGSPIVEADDEDEDAEYTSRRSNKRAKHTSAIPTAELEFSYVHVGTPPPPVDEQAQGPTGEPSSSRTPHSTSVDPTTPTPMQAPAQAESSQRSVAKPNEIAEQRAVRHTPTLSTPQQPVIERTGAQSNNRQSDAHDADQESSAQRRRSNSTTPLATSSSSHLAVCASSNHNPSPVTRQGLTGTRVAQGSARVQRNRNAYLQANGGSSRLRGLHLPRTPRLAMGSVEIYEDSEHEDDDDDNPWTVEEFKGWKSDLRTARNAYESVRAGERLPEPEPSMNGQRKITRRKLGQTSPASRPKKLRAMFEWTQSSRKNILPPKETLIALLDAHVRSAAPSPASQHASSRKSTPRREEYSSPQNASNEPGAASSSPSTGVSASPHSEAKQSAQDYESDAESLNNDQKNNMMSPTASEVDDTQQLPTTPSQTPSQKAPEPRAWSSAILTSVKKVVTSPFKFFGRTPTTGGATTRNETEFTFTHPLQPAQPVTTPTPSKKQRVKPQSEPRVISHDQSQISSLTRVPQTERRRRQNDKPPMHMRGLSSAPTVPYSNNGQAATTQQPNAKKLPVHMRGVVPVSTINEFHEEQAATRQQQHEAETARVAEEEKPHISYQAPDPDAPESDDGENYAESDDEANEGQTTGSGSKMDWASLTKNKPNLQVPGSQKVTETISQRLNRLFGADRPPLAVQPNLRRVHFEYEEPIVAKRTWGPTAELQFCKPGELLNYTNRVTQLDPDDPTNTFYFVRDPSRRLHYYRMVNIDEPDWICWNAFGEEALFYMVPGGLNGETYWEILHGDEVSLRNGLTKLAWANWLNQPANREKERGRLLTKWERLPESRRAALLPGLPKHLKTIMGIEYSGPSQECAAWRCGDTSLEKYEQYRIYEADRSTSRATTGGSPTRPTGCYRFPSPTSSDGEDSEEEGVPARAPTSSTPATPTPPPKPRPGNAQLPQPLPASTALANTNQYRHKAENALLHGPSKLRNVTQMSPVQEGDKENRGGEESEEAKTKEVFDLLRLLNGQGKILAAPLPLGKVMVLPGSFGKISDSSREEMNREIKVAFDKKNASLQFTEL